MRRVRGVWGAMRVAKTPTDNNSTEHSSRQYNIDYSVPQETLTQANNPVKNVPDDRTTAPAQTTKENDNKNTPYTGSYALPMGTDIRKDYSADEMVKNKTTNDWRVHNGIDFGGAQGNDVIAIQNGRVARSTPTRFGATWSKSTTARGSLRDTADSRTRIFRKRETRSSSSTISAPSAQSRLRRRTAPTSISPSR